MITQIITSDGAGGQGWRLSDLGLVLWGGGVGRGGSFRVPRCIHPPLSLSRSECTKTTISIHEAYITGDIPSRFKDGASNLSN